MSDRKMKGKGQASSCLSSSCQPDLSSLLETSVFHGLPMICLTRWQMVIYVPRWSPARAPCTHGRRQFRLKPGLQQIRQFGDTTLVDKIMAATNCRSSANSVLRGPNQMKSLTARPPLNLNSSSTEKAAVRSDVERSPWCRVIESPRIVQRERFIGCVVGGHGVGVDPYSP